MTTIPISVIIPTYNRAHLLPRALKSVFAQTYSDFEVIVVDDGSTDNTSTIVNDFDSQRIHYIRHEDNRGVAAARNTGLITANGKYIAFLDSDDAWFPWKLEKQVAAIEASSPHTGMIYSPAIYLKGDKGQLVPASVSHKCGNVYSDVMRLNFFAYLQASLIKSECFERIGLFDSNMRGTDDIDMLIRITKYFDVCCVDEPMCIVYVTKGNYTSSHSRLAYDFIYLINKYADELNLDKVANAKFHSRAAHSLCEGNIMPEGRKYLIKAIIINPSNVKVALAFLVSLFGHRAYTKIYEVFKTVFNIF